MVLRQEAPPTTLAVDTPPPSVAAEPPAPSIAASEPRATVAVAEPTPQPVVRQAPPAPAAPPPARAVNLSDAFADLRGAAPAAAPASGAVDITKLQPRREQAAPPKPAAAPKPPPVPSRHWVQVATGRNVRALATDWRRIKREAGGLLDRQSPSTADWGQTNRLVVGPFATAAAADQLIAKLKDKKIDTFRFTSDVGEEVKPLAGE